MPGIISKNLPSLSSLWDKLNNIINTDELEDICSDFESIFSEQSTEAQSSNAPTVTTPDSKPSADANSSPTPSVVAPAADATQAENEPNGSSPDSNPPTPSVDPAQPVNASADTSDSNPWNLSL